MDFSIPEEMQSLLDRIRAYVNDELIPLERDFLTKEFAEIEPKLREKRAEVREMGLASPHMEKEFGGLGLSVMELGLVGAELGRSPVGHFVFNCQAPDSGNMEVLAKYANDEQKDMYLKPLVAGQIPDTAKARGLSEEEVKRDVLLAAQPTKQFVETRQLGALAAFLCTDAAAQITGAALPVDGGWTAQ